MQTRRIVEEEEQLDAPVVEGEAVARRACRDHAEREEDVADGGRRPSAWPKHSNEHTCAIPYRPSSTMMLENSTQTGVGATACASASQKWNGTMAP